MGKLVRHQGDMKQQNLACLNAVDSTWLYSAVGLACVTFNTAK